MSDAIWMLAGKPNEGLYIVLLTDHLIALGWTAAGDRENYETTSWSVFVCDDDGAAMENAIRLTRDVEEHGYRLAVAPVPIDSAVRMVAKAHFQLQSTNDELAQIAHKAFDPLVKTL